ncbi:MAG: glutamate-1-semialdehyde 2,1-aminomutase [Acidimicrobiales bacterium]|jgi:glutamate-1-semialdehyde 2,1-aminomutase|nr:glutamate-1-semialdehyde 2,1-aminomutase [Acidimicrobiales bacterium]|tara:strand:- start:1075 stop:2349 length:1275 start_codon:yes stop_codon:yes gene_type:complete
MTGSNASLFRRAQRVTPGGVNSPVRAFGSVGGTPYFVERGEGPYVWDSEGRRYIDYVQSYGPGILGHAHPTVVEAVAVAAGDGTSFGAPTEAEVILAEMVVDRIAGLESVRFVSSGTEATMSAIRLARGATGRPRIVKFAGCYHGHSDALLAAGGSGVANQGLTGCDGVTVGAVADTVVAPYNVVPELDDTVAAVIVEPVAANMGLVAPAPGFLEGLRSACDATGALFIFDEVITGFRLARGGAADHLGVTPDLWCFGKVIGGGLPVGAFGGSTDLMSNLAPLGGVYQAGTLSGNPLAMAAGRATLDLLDQGAYDRLTSTSRRLAVGLAAAFTDVGLACVMPRIGSLLGVFFGDVEPTDFDEASRLADNGVYPKVFHALLERGVAWAPGAYEALFPSLAHTDAVVDETILIAAEAAVAVASDLT